MERDITASSYGDSFNFYTFDSRDRAYIINKEDDIGDYEFGIYQNVNFKKEDENDYTVLSLEAFLDLNYISKESFENVLTTDLLEYDIVSLNGNLGKLFLEGHKKDTEDFEGIDLINKEEFEGNLNYFIKDKLEEFKPSNSLHNEDSFYDFISEENNKESANIKFNDEYMTMKIGGDTFLRVALEGQDTFNAKFSNEDITLLSNNEKNTLRLRSSDEPTDSKDIYIDSKSAGFVNFLKEYRKNDLTSVLSDKIKETNKTKKNTINSIKR